MSVTYVLNPMTTPAWAVGGGVEVFTETYPTRWERNLAIEEMRAFGYDYVPALMGYGVEADRLTTESE